MESPVPHWCHGTWSKCDGKPETFVQGDDVIDRFLVAYERQSLPKDEEEKKNGDEPDAKGFMDLVDGKEDLLLTILSYLHHTERGQLRMAARDVHDLMSGPQKVLSVRYRAGNLIELMPMGWTKNSNAVSILLPKASVKVMKLTKGEEVFFRPPMMFKAYDQQQDFPRGRIVEVRPDGVHVVQTWSWRLATGTGATFYCQWGDIRRGPSRSKFEMLPEQRVWKASELKADAQKLFLEAQADEKMVSEYEAYLSSKAPSDGSESPKKKPKKLTGKAALKLQNIAFVFVKPHAAKKDNDKVVDLVRETLTKQGMNIQKEGDLEGPEIDSKRMIDSHYHAIANRAVLTDPCDLSVAFSSQRKFEDAFKMTWNRAVYSKKMRNINTLQKLLDEKQSTQTVEGLWDAAKAADKVVKLGGGFYVAPIQVEGDEETYYLLNGFYQSMRAPYIQADSRIHYFSVSWDPSALSFQKFRDEVLGSTDPSAAPEGSLRRAIFEGWEALGLSECPDTGNNGVHGSASPFEALVELHNWLGQSYVSTDFGQGLLGGSMSERLVDEWAKDPVLYISSGVKGSLFDALENLDALECCLKARSIAANPVIKLEASKRQYATAVDYVEGEPLMDPGIDRGAKHTPSNIVRAGISELKITIYSAIATCCKKLLQLYSGTAEGDARKKSIVKELLACGDQATKEIESVRMKPGVAKELVKRIPKAKLFAFMLARSQCLSAAALMEEREYDAAVALLEAAKEAQQSEVITKDLERLIEAQKAEIDRMLKSAKVLNKKQQSKDRGRWASAFKKNSQAPDLEAQAEAQQAAEALKSYIDTATSSSTDAQTPVSAPFQGMSQSSMPTSQPSPKPQSPKSQSKPQAPKAESEEEEAEVEEDDEEIGYAGWAVALGAIAAVGGLAMWYSRRGRH